MKDRVIITEVVTRDGFQNADVVVSADDKLRLLDKIVEAGVKSIEVGAFSQFESMKKMRNTGEVFRRLKMRPDVSYRALVYEPQGVAEAAECGCKKIKINISASATHHAHGTGLTIDGALDGFAAIAKIAEKYEMETCGSISLPFRSPFPGEGTIEMDLLYKIIDRMREIGIREISMSDSAGLGDPAMIYERISTLADKYPDVSWMLHMHNTYGLGLAGVEAAYRAGVRKFDASLMGLGGCPYIKGAAGNVSTEDVAYLFHLMGVETGIDLTKAIEAGKLAAELVEGKGTDSYIQAIAAHAGDSEVALI